MNVLHNLVSSYIDSWGKILDLGKLLFFIPWRTRKISKFLYILQISENEEIWCELLKLLKLYPHSPTVQTRAKASFKEYGINAMKWCVMKICIIWYSLLQSAIYSSFLDMLMNKIYNIPIHFPPIRTCYHVQ